MRGQQLISVSWGVQKEREALLLKQFSDFPFWGKVRLQSQQPILRKHGHFCVLGYMFSLRFGIHSSTWLP